MDIQAGDRVKISDEGKRFMMRSKRLDVVGTVRSISIKGKQKFCVVLWDGRKSTDRFAPQFLTKV